MKKWKKWLRSNWIRYVIFFLSAIAGTTAFSISLLADGSNGKTKEYYLIWGGFAAFGVVLMAFLENRHAESHKSRTQRLATQTLNEQALLYNLALVPLSASLRDLCAEYIANGPGSHLDSFKDVILDKVLQSAVMLTAPPAPTPRARSTLWLLDPSSSGGVRFVMERTFPNHRTPRFSIEGVGAAHMLNEILVRDDVFWLDGKSQQHSYLLPPPHGYKPVIAAPVRHGTENIGVLAVDSIEFGELQDRHVDLVKSLANILAASIALK